jgi:hypothetical protein
VCGSGIVFMPETAEKVQAELQKHMGGCPCERGERCPLMPADLGDLMPLRPRMTIDARHPERVLLTYRR